MIFVLLGASLSAYLSGRSYELPLFLLGVFLGLLWLRFRHERQRELFLDQLDRHRHEFERDTSVIMGNSLVTKQSQFTTYYLHVGFLLSNITIPSEYRRVDGSSHGESMLYSILSLIAGWWSLPLGPVITLKLVRLNMSGGMQQNVDELLGNLGRPNDASVADEKQSPADQEPTAHKQPTFLKKLLDIRTRRKSTH